MRVLGWVLGAVCLVAVAMLLVFTLGMRTKSPAVLDAVRKMNRTFINPRQGDAGTPGPYASVIRQQNVPSDGVVTVVHEGRIDRVSHAEVVPIETADAYFSRKDQRLHRLFGTHEGLRVRRVHSDRAAHQPINQGTSR